MRLPSHVVRNGSNPLGAAMMPMIDVVFLLLVFFLCTATFEAPEEDLAASLLVSNLTSGSMAETVQESPDPPLEEVTLVGARAGEETIWTLNEGASRPAGPQLVELLTGLSGADRTLPVTIEAGGAVPLGDLVQAYDAARAAGFARVLIATSVKPAEGPGSP